MYGQRLAAVSVFAALFLLPVGKPKKGQFYRPLSDLDGGPKICISQVPPPAVNSRGFQTQNKKPRGVVAQ